MSGELKGRKLIEIRGRDTRPTSDMVKESVFNIIQFDIEGRRVLDLFAGTGQLGIEALSRGARLADFVDESAEAVRVINENIRICGLGERSSVTRMDALTFLSRCGKNRYDIIFLDPPYESGLIEKSLQKIIEFDILRENGIIICESKMSRAFTGVLSPYGVIKDYRYGTVKITLIGRIF